MEMWDLLKTQDDKTIQSKKMKLGRKCFNSDTMWSDRKLVT